MNETQIKQRSDILRSWLNDWAQTADAQKGKIKRDLNSGLDYVWDVAGFGIPTTGDSGKWGLTRWPGRYETHFYVVPLLTQDAKLHAAFGDFIKTAYYNESSQTIFLPPWEMSPTWRTVIFNHEVMHAMAHRRKWHRRKKLGHWAEEAEIYRAEAYLASKLYGYKYNAAVNKLALKFAPQIKAGKLGFNSKKIVPDATIARIFGEPKSDYEQGSHRTLLLLDGMYRAIDDLYKAGGRKHDMHSRTITFWFCRPKAYAQWRDEQKLKNKN